MKKTILIFILVLFCIPMVFGAIVTNNNQSALFIRFPARHASTDIDAVYYNPAGTTKLADGFHLALHNQSLFQEKTVTNMLPFLNADTYIGDVKAPIFPSLFVVYKKGNLAISFGFGPNAGGGSADFTTGLPSFEESFALFVPVMNLLFWPLPTTQYDVDIAFKGTSVYYGFQLNAAYAFHDMITVAVGGRFIYAANTYEGSISNVQFNTWHPLINPTADLMSAVTLFGALFPPLAPAFADMDVDAKEVGTAFTPIFSMNFNPVEGLNIGVRYELNTNLELETQTTIDDVGMFPDGFTFRSDIPAILALGMEYDIVPELKAAVSFTTYFDKNANWEGREAFVNSNTYDLAFALQYAFSEKIAISAGYLMTKVDVADGYQVDLSHELSSSTIGFGGRFTASDNLSIDVGGIVVSYTDADVMLDYDIFGPWMESYGRSSWGFTIGINYHK